LALEAAPKTQSKNWMVINYAEPNQLEIPFPTSVSQAA